MKIVVLGTRGFPEVQGGVETHCENLYPRLASRGCEITVFTRAPYTASPKISYKGVRLVPLSCPKNKFLEAFIHTFKGVLNAQKLRPDLLHIHASGPSLCVPLAKWLGMKVVMTSHGPEHRRKKWAGFPKYVLLLGEWLGVRWSDAVISISNENAVRLQKRHRRNIHFIPNGVDLPPIVESDGALTQFKLKKQRYVLAVGRFVPEKGFLDLVKAFQRLRRPSTAGILTDLKLVIVGQADHEDRYSRELKFRATLSPNTVLTGFLSGRALHELYRNAGLFVLPSYYEGLPIVLLEAMSYGLSCIAGDIAANRELPLEESRFFQPGDIRGIADKILEFINKPFTESQKARQAALIAQKYNWDQIAQRVWEVYGSLIKQRVTP